MSKTVLTKTMSFLNAGNWLSLVPLGVGVRVTEWCPARDTGSHLHRGGDR